MLLSHLQGAPRLSGFIRRRRYQVALPFVSSLVLDVGCSTAYLLSIVGHLEAYVGVDLNERFLDQAKQTYPQYDFYQLDLEHQPLPADLARSKFETVTMLAVLEHLARPKAALEK